MNIFIRDLGWLGSALRFRIFWSGVFIGNMRWLRNALMLRRFWSSVFIGDMRWLGSALMLRRFWRGVFIRNLRWLGYKTVHCCIRSISWIDTRVYSALDTYVIPGWSGALKYPGQGSHQDLEVFGVQGLLLHLMR